MTLKLVKQDNLARAVEGGLMTQEEAERARQSLVGSMAGQTDEARAHLVADLSHEPVLPWIDLARITGPLLRGQLWIALARPENGKTCFAINVADKLVREGHGVAYFGTEEAADRVRLRLACLRAGVPVAPVLMGKWHELGDVSDAKQQIDRELTRLMDEGLFFVSPNPRPSTGAVKEAAEEAAELGCRLLMLDHFHRLAVDVSPGVTHGKSEAVRRVQEITVRTNLTTLMLAQARRGENALTKYLPPTAESGMDTSALEQEATVLLGLWRPLKPSVDKKLEQGFLRGEVPPSEIARKNTMAVRVLKHRLVSDWTGHTAYLHVEQGLLCNQYRVA